MTLYVDAFRAAIRAAGLTPADVIKAGRFHRFPGEGKRNGNTAGWAKLFPDGRGGVFGDFSTGLVESWQAEHERPRSFEERQAFRGLVEQEKAQAEAKHRAERDKAAGIAKRFWDLATAATVEHPYLAHKGVQPHGVRLYRGNLVLRGMACDGALLVPIRNANGELRSVQFIAAKRPQDGNDKRYLHGGERIGCYHAIGKSDAAICLTEGYATGASVHEATGYAVAVTFSADNLEAVARSLTEKYPDLRLILCADDDYRTAGNPGLTKATQAARAVGGLVAIPDFGADRPDGATDFNDLLQHRGANAIKRAIANAKAPEVSEGQLVAPSATATDPARGALKVLTIAELLTMEIPERETILSPWLLSQSLTMLHSYRGFGKTHVALGSAYAVATGGSFLTWKADRPRPVLYLDGEMPAALIRDRLRALVEADERDFDPPMLRIVTPDVQDGPMPDLATAEGQLLIEGIVADAELIIVDNISTLVRDTERENDAESWREVGAWALRTRQRGRAVLFVHHDGKSGEQRGTSKREDTLDAVIQLKRPADYSPEEGARFEIHFRKYRPPPGAEVKPIEARLTTGEDGRQAWTWRDVEESTHDRVLALHADGLKLPEIAAELGVNKSTVSRHLKRARELGEITDGKR